MAQAPLKSPLVHEPRSAIVNTQNLDKNPLKLKPRCLRPLKTFKNQNPTQESFPKILKTLSECSTRTQTKGVSL